MRNWKTNLLVGIAVMGIAGSAMADFHKKQKHPAPYPCMGLGRDCIGDPPAVDGSVEMRPLDEETVHYIGY